MDQSRWCPSNHEGLLQNSNDYEAPQFGVTASAGVDTRASQTSDRRERVADQSLDAMLSDNQTFECATNLARSKQQIEREKSEGVRRSKTVDGLPKCEIVAVVLYPETEVRKSPEHEKSEDLRKESEAIFNLSEIRFFWGATEEQYYKILAGKTPRQLEEINEMLIENHGVSLESHLKEKFGANWTSFEDVLSAANKWEAGEKAFKTDLATVDCARTDKILEQLAEAERADPPYRAYGFRTVIGWAPGEHPAEKLLQSLSAAEIKALKDTCREKRGYELKDHLSKLEYGVGERIERTLLRDDEGALDKLTAAERADVCTRAETLYRAMLPKKEPGGDTPEDAFFTALEKQSPEQRAAINEAFWELSGTGLEGYIKDHFSGDKQEKALNYLKFGSRDESAKLHLALTEGDNEKARMLISTMKSDELAKLEKDFQRYGQSLDKAIMSAEGLTDATRDALKIYRKGADKITDQDREALLDISLHANEIRIKGDGVLRKLGGALVESLSNQYSSPGHNRGDVKMFNEIMAGASREFREKFMDAGGEEKVERAFAFEGWRDALEYARHGRLSLEREIKKQIGFWSDDHEAILKAADENHDDDDHKQYIEGARVFNKYLNKLDAGDRARFEWEARGPANASRVLDLPNVADMSEAEKNVYAKFQEVNSAMDRGLFNENGMKFRDHVIYAGGVEKAISDFDQLSWNDLQKLKPKEAREEYIRQHNIDLLSEPAQKKITEALERRLAAERPEDLKYADGQSVATTLEPLDLGWIELPRAGDALDAIEHMSLAEQVAYRANKDGFKDKVDRAVESLTNDEYKTAARHMLDSVAAGKCPEGDFIDLICIEANKKETDEPQVIRYVEEAFSRSQQGGESPTLYERITHPRPDHPEDQALKERLDKALHKALEDDEYARWGRPVLEHGRLTIEQKLDIDREKGDKKSTFVDIQDLASAEDPASSAERQKIVSDEHYREQVLGQLSPDQRELAESMLKHGEERHRILTDPSYQQRLLESLPADKRQTAQMVLSLVAKDSQILSDAHHREGVVGAMVPEQRHIAESTLRWGAITSEDAVRSYVLGTGVSKEDMMAAVKHLSPEQIEQVHEQYALKYHQDVVQVLSDKLSGDDRATVLQDIRIVPVTAREALEDAQEIVAKSNSGFGADFTSWWGSGAGDIAADRILQLQAKIEQAKAAGRDLSVDEAKKLADDAVEYTRLFESAKEKAADEFANAILTAASFVVPGGMSLKLLALAVGGGVLKVGLKEVIAGNGSAEDFVSGFLTTGLSALGPGQIARAARLGERVAVQAGSRVAVEAEMLLVEGAGKKLAGELRGAAAEAFAHGGGVIEDKVLNRIVDRYARAGATDLEKTALRKLIKGEFESAAEREIRQGIKNTILREGLGVAAGAAGGAIGAVSDAAFHWDGNLSFSDNMSRILDAAAEGAAGGAQGAFIFGNAFKIGGRVFHTVLGKQAEVVGHMSPVATEGEFAVIRPEHAPAPKGETVDVSPDGISRVGTSDYYVNGQREVYKKVGDGADGKIRLVRDEHASVAASESVVEQFELDSSNRADASKVASRVESDRDPIRALDKRSLREQAGTELASAGDLKSFRKNIFSRLEGWEALGNSERVALAKAQAHFDGVFRSAKQTIAQEGGPSAVADFHLSDKMRQKLEGKPGLLAKYEEYLSAREALAQANTRVRDSIVGRKRQLEGDLNEYLRQRKLPAVTISAAMDLGDHLAQYDMGRGVMRVTWADLAGATSRQRFAASIMHELKHLEQDSLIIAKYAQEAGIGGAKKDAVIQTVQKRYEQTIGQAPSREHIEAILSARRGEPLTTSELTRATKLETSFADLIRRGQTLSKDLRMVESWANQLQTEGSSALSMSMDLTANPLFRQIVLGAHVVPAEVSWLMNNIRAINQGVKPIESWPETEARKILTSVLHNRKEELARNVRAHDLSYRHRLHEKEAYAVQELARREVGGQVMEMPTDLTPAERVHYGIDRVGDPEILPNEQAVPADRGAGEQGPSTEHGAREQALPADPGVQEQASPTDHVAREQALPTDRGARQHAKQGDVGPEVISVSLDEIQDATDGTVHPSAEEPVSSRPAAGRDQLANGHEQSPENRFRENPLYASTPQEVKRFLDEASTPQSSQMMIRALIDDTEKQMGVRITAADHERLLNLREQADRHGLSLTQDRELNELELRFATIRRLYRDRTGQRIGADDLAAALRDQPLSSGERAHAEILMSTSKNVKAAGEKYLQFDDDLRVTISELQNLDSPDGAMNLIAQLAKDDGNVARHLFDRGILPSEVQDLVATYKQFMVGTVRSWPEQRARSVLEAFLGAQRDSLQIAREVMHNRFASGLQDVDAYMTGMKLADRARSASAGQLVRP